MKKQYAAPEAEKVMFSYEANVVASGYVKCPGVTKYNGIPNPPVLEEACPKDKKYKG